MCRKTKLTLRLQTCVKTNAELGPNRPKLHALDDVIAAIRTGEDNNLDFAEIIIGKYEKSLETEAETRGLRNKSNAMVEEKKQKEEFFKSFKHSPISCTGAGGTILPYAVNAPTTQSKLLYFGLSQTGQESALKTHNQLRKLFSHYDKEVLPLELSEDLSRRATKWAVFLATQKHIKRDHSNSLDDNIIGKLSYDVKENIFYQSTLSSVLTPEFVISDWFGEFDNAYKKYPETTKGIGHFLTVVSRSVDAVGVGMAKALNGLEYWVCQYRVRSTADFNPSAKALDVDWDCFPSEVWGTIKQVWHSTKNYKAVLESQKEQGH